MKLSNVFLVILLFIIPKFGIAQIDRDSILFCQRMEKIKSSKGVIEINYDHFYDGDKYEILDNSYSRLLEISSINNINSIYNSKDTLIDLTNLTHIFPFFKPLCFYFEPNVIQFECISVYHSYWEVFINKDLGIKGYIKIDTTKYRYKDWYNYYLGSMVMTEEKSIIKRDTNDLNGVKDSDLGADEVYVISGIKGDWAKLICINDGFTICSEKHLWIKWISNNKILINLAFSR